MAGVPDDALFRAGPWPAGVNNLAPEGKLPRGEDGRPIALREADNFDLDREGWPSRRAGAERFYDGVLTHSLWSDDHIGFGLFIDDARLRAVFEDESTQDLGVDVAAGMPASYARINDRIYWSNTAQSGLVTLGLEAFPWAPPQPSGQPVLAPAPGLGLDPGRYQVAVTFIDVLGRESGTGVAVLIELEGNNGIALSSIPQPDPALAPWINVYLTGANDKVPRLHSRIPAGQTSMAIGAPARGRKLETQHLIPMPPGQIVRYHNGRHYVASGREMMWSPALHYGMLDPMRNRIRLPKVIDIMEPVGDGTDGAGVFVAAGPRTYFFGGSDPNNYRQAVPYAHGAVRGTGMTLPGEVLGFDTTTNVAVWYSKAGQFCAGLPGGQVVPLKRQEAACDKADSGAVLFREANGIRQLLAALRAPSPQGMAIRDRAVGRVIHDET